MIPTNPTMLYSLLYYNSESEITLAISSAFADVSEIADKLIDNKEACRDAYRIIGNYDMATCSADVNRLLRAQIVNKVTGAKRKIVPIVSFVCEKETFRWVEVNKI